MRIFTDGGSRGNPGPAASAFVVYEGEKLTHEEGKYLGESTNNKAEYTAVLMAMTWVSENKPKGKIEFFIDSELVVKQLKGEYKIKNVELSVLADEIRTINRDLKIEVSYTHVRREKNKDADALVNKTLDSHVKR